MDKHELQSKLQESYDAVERLQAALRLPFRPIPFQPVAELWRGVNDLIQENAVLSARLTEALAELSKYRAADNSTRSQSQHESRSGDAAV